MFTSGAYTLQENTTIDGKIITAGELVVNTKYLCSMQVETKWYWNQQSKHHVITVPTRACETRRSEERRVVAIIIIFVLIQNLVWGHV